MSALTFQDITILTMVLLALELIGLVLAFDAVMQKRSSQGAIAWGVALLAIPPLIIPCYLIFGRSRFHGYAEAVREAQAAVDKQFVEWHKRMSEEAAPINEELGAVEAVIQQLIGLPFTAGNQVELLEDADATYTAMRTEIGKAENYILVQFYIVRDDRSGRELRDALIAKARTGVRIYFLYDEIGSLQLPSSFGTAMRDAGIEVSGFRTTNGPRNRFQLNFRNHRKLLVVDGSTSFIGGHNLGDEYLHYRDTHLCINGPATQQIQLTFLKDWYWATRQLVHVNSQPQAAQRPGLAVAIANTGPADMLPGCSALFTTVINTAARRVWITSPYFVPDDVLVRALQAAALRGVDVRILLPGRADSRLVELASRTYYGDMIDCGVRLFRYRERFMHHKVFLVDGSLAGVGTVNLDNRSLYLNFEETALVAAPGFADQVEAMLLRDLAQCDEVDRGHFDGRALPVRIAARVARLASPVL